MLGVAIRIAERMGINNESELAKCTALEAEMRRRLWWSLVLFDTRIGEMADYKTIRLAPTWDCKIPLNVNDSELRPEMKELPGLLGNSTEALFTVVRSEIGEFIRNTMFYLDFTAPALKPIAKDVQNGPIPEGGELVILEKIIEDKYLKSCDLQNPLHFLTAWTARGAIAKYRLLEHYSKSSRLSVPLTEAQRDTAISYAISMLECDTKIVTSPLTKGFLWLVNIYFPFPAYIQIVQDLRRRPMSCHAEHAWEVMSDNCEAHFGFQYRDDSPFFKLFAKIGLKAWEAREFAFKQLGKPLTLSIFVSSIRDMVAQSAQGVHNDTMEQQHDVLGMAVDDFLISMPMEFGSYICSLEAEGDCAETGAEVYPHMPGRDPLALDVNDLYWSAMNWSSVYNPDSLARPGPHIPRQGACKTDMNQSNSSG